MSNLFKKALGAFVEFDEEKAAAVEAAAPEETPAPVEIEPSADLSQDSDIVKVREATKLLASLPLSEFPVDKARELIVRTLQFAGLETEALAGSFLRAQSLYQAQIQGEQQAIATRQQQNLERLKLLEAAIAEEKEQCAAEVSARNQRIEATTAELVELEKAMAFFAPKE